MSMMAGDSSFCCDPSDVSRSSPSPLGISAKELQCPICVETIQDAFVTPCGHSFCFACLGTHLRDKPNCPSCGAFLTMENAYPNFLLNKVSGVCTMHPLHMSLPPHAWWEILSGAFLTMEYRMRSPISTSTRPVPT